MAGKKLCGLRIRGSDLNVLKSILFPGDGKEAVAFALCGQSVGPFGIQLLVREVVPLPTESYQNRSPLETTWNTSAILPLLHRLEEEGLSLLKLHSHPGGLAEFSEFDDVSDQELLPHCYAWNPRGFHGSVVLTETCATGRIVEANGTFRNIDTIRVVGSRLRSLNKSKISIRVSEAQRRLVQAFGEGTYAELAGLRVAVVGASGTGSLLIEALVRTGVRQIVIIDPQFVEGVNLNRILHSSVKDAKTGKYKVRVAGDALRSIGFDIAIVEMVGSLDDPEVVRAIANCDVVMGCVDNRIARQRLCRLAAYYLLPYIDTGVAIHANSSIGEIQSVNAAVHYFEPGQSFIARGVFSTEALREEAIAKTDPAHHAEQKKAGYVFGVDVERPAVMPLNMIAAGLAANELLARIHGYRIGDTEGSTAETIIALDLGFAKHGADTGVCKALEPHIGEGDCIPLLGLAVLTEADEAA